MDAVVDRRCNDTNEVDDAVVIVVSEGYLESLHGVAVQVRYHTQGTGMLQRLSRPDGYVGAGMSTVEPLMGLVPCRFRVPPISPLAGFVDQRRALGRTVRLLA